MTGQMIPPMDLHAFARGAAIQALGIANAPIAQADAIVAAVTGSALRRVVIARAEIFAAGHTPENDEMLPIAFLPFEAQQHAAAAQAALGTTVADRDIDLAERELARTAAFCMAALDRLSAARLRKEV